MLSSKMTKDHHRWLILEAIKQYAALFVPHFSLKTQNDMMMDEVEETQRESKVKGNLCLAL